MNPSRLAVSPLKPTDTLHLTRTDMQLVVCALYQFTVIKREHLQRLRAQLLSVLYANHIRGTLLLAEEGINGTIAGRRAGIDAVLAWLRQQPGFKRITPKESYTDVPPFKRTRVKIKKEIVTIAVPDLNPHRGGVHIAPQHWNELLSAEDTLVVDVRNEYEVKIGSFPNAINPHTTNFREFPAFAECLQPHKHKNIAMYCTGGIRCEKSTAYLKQQGFEHVFQLHGGILNYLAKIPQAESRWQGECFVFDERVAIDHRLTKGSYEQCYACRMPLSRVDQLSEHYTHGVSCPHCYAQGSAEDKMRYQEREKQVELATARGAVHIGPAAMTDSCANRHPTTK